MDSFEEVLTHHLKKLLSKLAQPNEQLQLFEFKYDILSFEETDRLIKEVIEFK